MDLKQIVKDGLAGNKSKMVILTDMVRADSELDLNKAGAIYKEVAAAEGYLLDKDAKAALVLEIAKRHTTEDGFDREKATAELIERAHLTKTVATSHLKAYCLENKIEFPQVSRVKRDMEAVNEYYKTYFSQVDREAMEKALIANFQYTEKNVGAAYLKIGKDLGLIEATAAPGRTELAQWFATPANIEGDKEAIVKRLMEQTEVAKATAETRYGMYLFAKEFHRLSAQ